MTLRISLFLLVLAVGLAASQREESGEPTRLSIQKLLDDQTEAWNRGDLEAFLGGYWNSPELTFFSDNSVSSGWQSTLRRYRLRYQAEGREMGRLEFVDVRVEPLCADAAFVRGRFRLTLGEGNPTGLFTLIVRHTSEGWRIVHDHTSTE